MTKIRYSHSTFLLSSTIQFTEKMGEVENSEIPCTPWTTRMPKYAQPDLNYIGKPDAHIFNR